ncbi:MAG: ATP-dependent DNA helicase RecQ [Saprospiraceae bacterium]|jgi:ATP-dependent DNA helicase RecQ
MSKTHEVLNKVFGFKEFRPLQEEIIDHVLDNKDALAILPTGGGKSLCFQVPALCLPGLTLVISPLIALMHDQVTALKGVGVAAACIHSNVSPDEKRSIVASINDGSLKMLYMAPESFLQERFFTYISNIDISLFAIDEAHCISVWGNDFRPEYTKLHILKQQFPNAPIIALTATADIATQQDIQDKLGIANGRKFLGSFERPNLTIKASPGQDRFGQILRFLFPYKNESGIIYCLSKKGTESLAKKLNSAGYNAAYYHAGMDSFSRNRVQERFQNDEIRIVCATIAFGMGIDKSNVRFVIHFNLPKNIEGYYQEIGRAGRDGLPSDCLLFYSWADKMRLQSFIDDGGGVETFKRVQTEKLSRMWESASAPSCRTNLILNYFGEYRNEQCGHCDNCLNPPMVFDGTLIAQKALSAILRTQEHVGVNMLVDILRGSGRQDLRTLGYDQIKTFGAGRDLPYMDWKEYITQLLNQGLMTIDYVNGSLLKSTPLSVDVLKGKVKVQLVKFEKENKKAKKVTKTQLVQDELFEKLRHWRLTTAKSRGVPAYAVFSDATLKEIVDMKPLVADDLLMIDGIGEKKKADYGEHILDVIREYLMSQNHKKTIKGKTYIETLNLLKEGLTPAQIATKRGIQELTVYSHIGTLYEKGESTIDIDKYSDSKERQTIAAKWLTLGQPKDLKDIHDALDAKYSYVAIRMAISWAKREAIKNS